MGLLSLLVIAAVLFGTVKLIGGTQNNSQRAQIDGANLDDALADARRWVDRLGHQVLTISGTDAASTQAMADASERYNAANSALTQATTVRQAQLARESALEGLYYVDAAREILGLAPAATARAGGAACGRPGDGASHRRVRRADDPGVPERKRADSPLLPRRRCRWPPGACRMVLHGVVGSRSYDRCVGGEFDDVLLGHVRRHGGRS